LWVLWSTRHFIGNEVSRFARERRKLNFFTDPSVQGGDVFQTLGPCIPADLVLVKRPPAFQLADVKANDIRMAEGVRVREHSVS
jgi:hypothetical protein